MWNIKKVISKGDYQYALVPDHPNATENGYVLLHRVVMENHLGRILNTEEIVHHKDNNKKNNVISNLEVMLKKTHSRLHGYGQGEQMVKLKCPWCGKIFDRSKRQTHLSKHGKLNCTCCSNPCRGKLSRYVQMNGLTPTMESAISENILACYVKYNDEDNSEETNL